MCDSRDGAKMRSLSMPRDWARHRSGRCDLLLRPLRKAFRCEGLQRQSCMTRAERRANPISLAETSLGKDQGHENSTGCGTLVCRDWDGNGLGADIRPVPDEPRSEKDDFEIL